MLKTKAIFERKTNDFQPRDCVIEKIIEFTSQVKEMPVNAVAELVGKS